MWRVVVVCCGCALLCLVVCCLLVLCCGCVALRCLVLSRVVLVLVRLLVWGFGDVSVVCVLYWLYCFVLCSIVLCCVVLRVVVLY